MAKNLIVAEALAKAKQDLRSERRMLASIERDLERTKASWPRERERKLKELEEGHKDDLADLQEELKFAREDVASAEKELARLQALAEKE